MRIRAVLTSSYQILLLISILGSISVAQQPPLDQLQSLGDVRYHLISVDEPAQDYHIYVKLPIDYDSTRQYPTVYLLDGGWTFPLLASYTHYLTFQEEIPPVLSVGISYGTDDWQQGNMRGRDFTAPSVEREHWGGASDFLDFLQSDVIELVEEKYSANSQRRVIFGQSLGGQFVLFVAQKQPQAFWGYIASNPALHRNLDFFMEGSDDIAPSEPQPRLFVSSATEDDKRFREPALKWMEYWVSQPVKPWHLKTTDLEGHGHFSAVTASFREGIRWIFETEN